MRVAAKALAENLQSPKPLSTTQVLLNVGYSPNVARTPNTVTKSETFQELLAQYLPEDMLAIKHVELLNATRMDHMVFPLGPKGEDDINLSGGTTELDEPNIDEEDPEEEFRERTTLTDKEIIDMLAEVNCKVRRIVHGNTARHVYFWSADNMARDKALDKAYKLRKRYGEEQGNPNPAAKTTYNFIFSAPVQERVREMEEDIKKLLTTPNAQPIQEAVEAQSEGSGDSEQADGGTN